MNIRTQITFALFVLSTFCYSENTPAPMTAVDVLNVSGLFSPRLSPDGEKVAFVKYTSDWRLNKQVTDVWLLNLKSKETRQLTFNGEYEGGLAWSPDGKYISFISERKGDKYEKIYLLPMAGGEAFSVGNHQRNMDKYHWGKKSNTIYFLAYEPISKRIKDRKKDKDDMFAFEEALSYRHIWKMDLATGNTKKVTDGSFYISSFELSRDNSFIVFNKRRGITIDDSHSSELWSIGSDGSKPRQLTKNTYSERNIQISPDDQSILFTAGVNASGDYYYETNAFVMPLDSGNISMLEVKEDIEIEDAAWSKNGKHVFLQVNTGVQSELWSFNRKSQKSTALTKGKHAVRNWHYDAVNNKHVFSLVTPNSPGDLWLLAGKTRKAKQVTTFFDSLAQRHQLPQQKLVTWKTKDGVQLEGLLSLPLDYKEGVRYPLVTHVHGGPRSSEQYGQWHWRTYIPFITSKGYAFFSPNHRGGTGYGDDFLRNMVGGYFKNAHLDVLSGIDYLIEQGIADGEKLAISGWSAGGHMTNKIITHTNRFKAASSGAGAVDWVSMYGESDNRYTRKFWFGGSPWQKNAPLDVYRQHSPLKDMWKVKTPTLIFVGQRDIRVPKTQSILLFRSLKDLGVETALYIAPRERHGFRELRHKLFKINAELAWYEKHLKGSDYTWEAVPEVPSAK